MIHVPKRIGPAHVARRRLPAGLLLAGALLAGPALAQIAPAPSTAPATTAPTTTAPVPPVAPQTRPMTQSQPGSTPPAISTPGPNDAAAPQPGANSFTEAQARERIEARGFSAVMGLRQDDQGIWRGTATRNGAQANVAVDFRGNVFPQ
jgi:putative membrane protein